MYIRVAKNHRSVNGGLRITNARTCYRGAASRERRSTIDLVSSNKTPPPRKTTAPLDVRLFLSKITHLGFSRGIIKLRPRSLSPSLPCPLRSTRNDAPLNARLFFTSLTKCFAINVLRRDYCEYCRIVRWGWSSRYHFQWRREIELRRMISMIYLIIPETHARIFKFLFTDLWSVWWVNN